MPIDFLGTNLFTDLGFLFVLMTGCMIAVLWVKPYLKWSKYLNAFKIGLLQKAAEREQIDIETNVKNIGRKDIESIIEDKVAEALEFREEEV